MLEVSDLHLHYGSSHVLHGIDMRVGHGEIVTLFGRNGAGKTSLLKAIAGWVKPSRGEIRFLGGSLAGRPPNEVTHRGIGFVPEDRRIFPGLTVHENLELGLMQFASAADARQGLERIYTRFPRLRERREQTGTTLSGGEQQMLAMARAMVRPPKLLLVDEPSEGLAPMIVDEVFALIRELRQSGASILLVEQNMREALAVSDRFYAIERGRIVMHGDASNEDHRRELAAAIAI
ncbi:amino acid/amide ABC transporter ATP-binding protein 2, HAAT family [Variovorax sp. HW608]|uniref:ABC transporter ATP-binding protein n=1 Tax=Variovorax sp. HW608 TaxID=1034889 RepID=UPI00081FEBB4|nr:ABC transporter ATP-binding protein [Variovorax sp. HW608]SCK14762.1 amino acid/amide ABC transporter ATP-binding protein 2, HAAT family [Variovorax sp. HW608]